MDQLNNQLAKHPQIKGLLDKANKAQKTLDGIVVKTPLLESKLLNKQLGVQVLFKPECLQKTGSFKFRGAYFKISQLTEEERKKGIIAYSSGNHAQGVAWAATLFNSKAKIIMPEDAPQIKINRTQAFGGEVLLYNRYKQIREALAEPYINEGMTLVPPYDDYDIMAGQATIGLEIIDELQPLNIKPDVLFCPVGGGGLIAGVSSALKSVYSDLTAIGVEPKGHDDTGKSLIKGKRIKNAGFVPTICDAIVTPTPGDLTFKINQHTVDQCDVVIDKNVFNATQVIRDELKLVVEPTGSVGLAALIANKDKYQDKTVVVILSGGNVDRHLFENN